MTDRSMLHPVRRRRGRRGPARRRRARRDRIRARRRRHDGRDPDRSPAAAPREPASTRRSRRGDHSIRMPDGREVFKRAVVEMAARCRELLEKSGLHVRRRQPADPPPGERADHAPPSPNDWASRRSRRRRRGGGRQHVGRLDPDRARPRVAGGADPRRRPRPAHVVRRGSRVGREPASGGPSAEPAA